jgi:hypothetical protein
MSEQSASDSKGDKKMMNVRYRRKVNFNCSLVEKYNTFLLEVLANLNWFVLHFCETNTILNTF